MTSLKTKYCLILSGSNKSRFQDSYFAAAYMTCTAGQFRCKVLLNLRVTFMQHSLATAPESTQQRHTGTLKN